MSASPEISVIVRTRDRLPSLLQALASLREQTFRDFEAVLVDDGEVPLDPRLIETPASAPVRVIRQDAPHGRSRALNTGLAAARGRYVAYLDDDDLFLPGHLSLLHGFITSKSGLRAVYSDALLVRQTRLAGGTYLDSEPVPIFGQEFSRSELLFSNFIPLLCLLHETALAAEAGWVDEELDLYEDWDFLIRLSAITPLIRLSQATALYRVRDDQTNATTVMPWLGPESEAQRRRILEKHRGEITPEVILGHLNSREARWDEMMRAHNASIADLQSQLDRALSAIPERETQIAHLKAALEAKETELAGSLLRERALAGRVEELEGTVHQMLTSVAWRLFTPYWKLKEALKRPR